MPIETWKCPKCGAENTVYDNFCGECGGKKPVVGIGIAQVIKQEEVKTSTNVIGKHWICPNCGAKEVASRFCPECGAKKPESKKIGEKNKKNGTLGVFGKILFTFFALVIIGGGIIAFILLLNSFRGGYEVRAYDIGLAVLLIFIGQLVQIGVIAWFSALIISYIKRKED